MARDPNKPKARPPAEGEPEVGERLTAELRRRGLTDEQISAAVRKRKRRKALEFAVVHYPEHGVHAPLGRRAADELCTVEFASGQLKLHPKTVLRFIRDGRLRATRVGKSYRILRTDLDAFSGVPAKPEAPAEQAWVTSIVDIPGVGPDLARKWARTVPNALGARSSSTPPMRAEVIYEPERSHLKVVIVGPPGDTVSLLTLVRVWLDQLEP
jgi:excisionase family DNA binding protein